MQLRFQRNYLGLGLGNYFENATTCCKRMRKAIVATQLKFYLLLCAACPCKHKSQTPSFTNKADLTSLIKLSFSDRGN